ncbi:PfkB family carbohydrate kinase [Saxibacter everestensis]|uniref:PfkB family carbohydrate kinase n=1 Tax=Saxibacter everestensis TaxID=2909229 RepID=A0ABY8QR67_9MICO|nr:PfkB family carbohydrate kinase [Brevibacteriaceae bacterium ZFBP1038]
MAPEQPAPRAVFVGLATLDVLHWVDAPPAANQKVTALRQDVAAGGPATNAAVTFAALGGQAQLISAVGASAAASVLREDLETHGVELIDVVGSGRFQLPVSAIAVTEASGERTIVSVDAAGQAVPVPAQALRSIAGAAAVLVDGHHPELALAAASEARKCGVPVILDAGRWKPVMSELLPLTDIAICSADFRVPGTTSSAQTAAELAALDVPAIAVTNGAAPISWRQQNQAGIVDVPEVRAVDTLGAGDSFHGAFAFFHADPAMEFSDALAAAARVAALRCQFTGPREWLGHLAELDLKRSSS